MGFFRIQMVLMRRLQSKADAVGQIKKYFNNDFKTGLTIEVDP